MGLVGILLIASPILGTAIHLQNAEPYSELYVLQPNHLASYYALNLTEGQNYSYILGATNHLTHSAYYLLNVKFRNSSDALPDLKDKTPSALPELYEYRFIIPDNGTWEMPLNFSISNASISTLQSVIKTLIINGEGIQVDKSSSWNSTKNSSYYQLFFELWLFNTQNQTFQFNNRFVGLSMNFTKT